MPRRGRSWGAAPQTRPPGPGRALLLAIALRCTAQATSLMESLPSGWFCSRRAFPFTFYCFNLPQTSSVQRSVVAPVACALPSGEGLWPAKKCLFYALGVNERGGPQEARGGWEVSNPSQPGGNA